MLFGYFTGVPYGLQSALSLTGLLWYGGMVLCSSTSLFLAIFALYSVLEHNDAAQNVRAAINKIFHINYLLEVTEYIDTKIELRTESDYPYFLRDKDWPYIPDTPEYIAAWGFFHDD